MGNVKLLIMLLLAAVAMPHEIAAQCEIEYEAGATVNVSDGDFAPHYIMANRYGTVTQGKSTLVNAKLSHSMDSTQRFSYGFGAEVWGGWASDVTYQRYSEGNWTDNNQHPARVWLQQLYGEIKYRGGTISLGIQQHRNSLIDADLGSGDLVLSGNARPMLGVRIGFVDFQNVPLTNGWVQVGGEIAYYKDLQDSWLENHYNYYNSGITRGSFSNYQRCYFRTKPSERFSVTVGMQSAAQFLGERSYYSRGKLTSTKKSHNTVEAFFKAFWPGSGKSGSSLSADVAYYEGNHIGSWDLAARYRLRDGSTIRGYFQKPFEDGSGIGMLNGFDGVYGLEYRPHNFGWITGAVVEYFDFTNQSGPMHWAPGDAPNSPIRGQATGADNYYNNYFYNGYQNHGLAIGSPLFLAPIYNSDGVLWFRQNLMQGFHAAIMGCITPRLKYRAMVMYRESWGLPSLLLLEPIHSTSAMIEGEYRFAGALPMSIKAQVALDRGSLAGNSVGCMVSVVYRGSINKKSR